MPHLGPDPRLKPKTADDAFRVLSDVYLDSNESPGRKGTPRSRA